uniref:Cytoplasmic dynein 2 heavy chain 1 n=1 Tax=Caenorhabditis japonica TaxID=281687 RepID=A0A8R1DG42_CAEJA
MSVAEKGDPRKVYVLRVASYLLGLNIVEEKLKNPEPLEVFVDSNTNLLVFSRSEQKLELSNKMKSATPSGNVLRVVFYKTQSIPLNNENYKSVVNVISANGTLNHVFLKSVQNVFGKELTEGNNMQLIAAVNELEESLLATVDMNGGGSLHDEIRSWKGQSGKAAAEYNEAFKQLQLLVETMEERSIDELSELVECIEDTCDELWNCGTPYPQNRMKILIEYGAAYLCEAITFKIDDSSVWRDEKVSEQLRSAIDVCDQLLIVVRLLTGQTWKRNVEHTWEGDPMDMKFLIGFRDRFDEILSLKSLGGQLEDLLQERGVREETEKMIETAMRGMAPLAYNPFTEPNWKSRLLVAERAIEGTIDRTLPILKQRLAPSSGDSQSIVLSLEKLKSFLCRSNIKEKLHHERETFLNRLVSMLSTKNQEFDEKSLQVDAKNFQFLTEIAARIVWIRQQTSQMESIRSLSKMMLNDLSNYSAFAAKLDEFIEKLQYAEKEAFDDWCRETVSLIDNKNETINLETTGKIMYLEASNRELNVNYSDRLLKLLKEVRQLSSLGFNIPSKILSCANNGEKYYRYGVILKQIAHFYNTIDQQMIPSQQSLMLEEAIAFEKLVIPRKDASNSASKVTWNDPKQLEAFIVQLQGAEQKLSNRNRRLRNVHMELIELAEKLMDLNIVKQNNEWKDIILKIRSKIKEEEVVHGAVKQNMKPWLIHWDFQLYKALLVQYEWGIESIQSQLATISVSLVFADQKIQLRPTIEEIRAKYYKELSKFLRIPDRFRGVQEDENSSKFFAQMIDRSMNLLPTIYEKAEQLMDKVATCDQIFSDGVVHRQSPGRPRTTSRAMDRNILRTCREDPRRTSTDIQVSVTSPNEPVPSRRTIRRRLQVAGLHGRRPVKKPLVSLKNREACVGWTKQHLSWGPREWANHIWSDESKFNMFGTDGIQWIRRPIGSRFAPQYQCPTVKHGGGSVMHENVPKHTSGHVANWFRRRRVDLLEWPSQSPDFNPIEHMWEELERRLKGVRASNANQKFAQLEASWKSIPMTVDWLVISQVDLEELIEENLKTAADWELQFKILKTKAREAERLPHELKFECILVSTAGVKAAIEDAIQRLYDALTWTLKHSISTTSQTISTFLTQATEVLSTAPKSIDEIAEANAKHVIFVGTNRKLKEEWKVMEEQLTLLRSVAGTGMEQIDNLEATWDRFEVMLDGHQSMIKDQVEVLKSNVETNVKGMKDEAEKLKARWDQFKPRSDALQGDREEMLKAIQFIKEKRLQWQQLSDGREKIEKECGQFGLNPPKLDIIDEIDDDIKQFEDNWLIYEMFNSELDTLAQEEWIVFRSKTYLFDEFLQKWMEKLKTTSQTHMSVRLMKDVEHFKEVSSALKFCRGDVLSADHWHEMFRFLGLPRGTTIEKLKFADLLSVSKNIIENVDQLKQLNSRAQGEVAIRDAIQELTLWAAQTEFSLADYKHSNGQNLKIIKEWKESINSLKDSQALLQSLKSSPYYSQFTDKTAVWETRLADLDVFLAQMNEIQRKWIYLEPIFGRGALPSEASRFSRVDSEYRAILNDVSKDARLVSLCNRQSLKKSLEQIVDQLNRCQKALNQFLEQKRTAFPRFYFIGDDDLLEILGQSTNPQVIQSHMKKLFQGINRVVFSSTGETIVSMVSAEGETVPLSKTVRIVPQVETWLQQLSDEMRRTLRDMAAQAVSDEQLSLGKYPSQVLCLAEEVKFTGAVENVLSGSKDINAFKTQLLEKLKTYTNMKVDDKVSDLKLKSLILDLIHHIDVADQLLANKAKSTSCWTWQRQLRFYLVNGGVVLRQVSSEFEYTYEYQGNYAKLVHTPLTDKCYLTLTQAMYMGLGGNPYGPAGTGKTESVKALAALMGRQVLVFNCDEGIDVTSMGRIFTGIVECGAWGCFDEFNRLDSTVLSVVSMQIQTIQSAIKSRSGSCSFGGKTVQVNPNSAIFVTLNPAGKGYGGRQKMPDNLKQLFRAVVMGRPDNELISSTILYSEGFLDAASLARKIVTIFQLSKQMLSIQQHYDWGLRALKVVLGGCGALRKSKSEKSENDLIVQALMLNTLSKLTFSDSERFNSLIDDIFPNSKKEMAKFDELVEPLSVAAKEMGIKLSDKQIEKVFQLYEQMRQRIGVVVVGAAGCGKSTIWKVLRRALVINKMQLRVTQFNPKAVNRNRLLGNMDTDTREWSDGIITMAAREVTKDTSVHHWIVCDGDIDPEWVEALNSVLDDNRLLTMPSGERIQFGSNVNFLFETDSLKYASPATVSRMGMIYISEEDVTPQDIVASWIDRNSEDLHADMPSWIEELFWKSYKWVKLNQIAGITNYALLRNGLTHLKASKTKTHFAILLFNGFLPYVVPEKRIDFAKSVIFQGMILPDPTNVCYDDRTDGIMTYSDDVSQSVTKEQVEREDMRPFVQTADAQRYSDIISSWLYPENRESFIITGASGCGKQHLLKHCFENDADSQLATLYCSAQSSSSHLLQLIQQNCVQASNPSGRVWKPKDRPNMILFLKGINLPAPDKYGTNELLALLQQLLTYQGFFDHNLEWVSIENIQFVGSMHPIGDGTSTFSNRLLSLLRCVSLNNTDSNQLVSIYRTYLNPILEEAGESNAETVASRMVDVYSKTHSNFRQSENIVFSFSPRDLTNWVVSLLRHELDSGKLDAVICFEAKRIFADRLPTESDKMKFDEILRSIIPVSQSNEKVFVTTGGLVPGDSNTGLPLTPINMTDFNQLLAKSINRFAFEVANFNSPLTTQLSFFCACIDRVLTSPDGHLFLPGRSGFGRRDAVRLIAHMHNMTVFSPPVTANFSSKQFDNELKAAISHAVTNNEHVILILEDHQLRKNTFLQAINSLLASGNVPGLFTQQELDGLVALISESANQASFTGALQQFLAHS